MPTIRLEKKRASSYQRHGLDAQIHRLYNSQRWKKLRDTHLMFNPLCERCLKDGVTTSGAEVHHVRPISTARTLSEAEQLAFDSTNLMTLCVDCHHKVHQELKDKK